MYICCMRTRAQTMRALRFCAEFQKFDACSRTRVSARTRNRKATATLPNARVNSTDIVYSMYVYCLHKKHSLLCGCMVCSAYSHALVPLHTLLPLLARKRTMLLLLVAVVVVFVIRCIIDVHYYYCYYCCCCRCYCCCYCCCCYCCCC
jgi:hypothetical protein